MNLLPFQKQALASMEQDVMASLLNKPLNTNSDKVEPPKISLDTTPYTAVWEQYIKEKAAEYAIEPVSKVTVQWVAKATVAPDVKAEVATVCRVCGDPNCWYYRRIPANEFIPGKYTE